MSDIDPALLMIPGEASAATLAHIDDKELFQRLYQAMATASYLLPEHIANGEWAALRKHLLHRTGRGPYYRLDAQTMRELSATQRPPTNHIPKKYRQQPIVDEVAARATAARQAAAAAAFQSAEEYRIKAEKQPPNLNPRRRLARPKKGTEPK